MFEIVVSHLRAWRSQLQHTHRDEQADGNATQALLEIDKVIGCLALCEKYGIHPGARVTVLPEPHSLTPSSEFRLIEDQETDAREDWLEVIVNGEPVRPIPGALIVDVQI